MLGFLSAFFSGGGGSNFSGENFNEISRLMIIINMAYDNNKSHKKVDSHSFFDPSLLFILQKYHNYHSRN